MKDEIEHILHQTAELHRELAALAPEIEDMLCSIMERMKAGGALYAIGNGGSAADAQHIAGELVGRFLRERKPVAALALTVDTSVLTALANDYGAENLFTRQIMAHVTDGDVVLAISTSGNSPNIVNALKAAKELGALNIGLGGGDGGSMRELCDHCICVPHNNTPRIQEAHQTLIHIICEYIEKQCA